MAITFVPTIIVSGPRLCEACHVKHTVVAPRQGFFDWRQGEYIQVALACLSDEKREILMSGQCDKMWAIFEEMVEAWDGDGPFKGSHHP